MSYLKKVELQRERNRITEERRKDADIRAARSAAYSFRRPDPKPDANGEGWLKRMLASMDPRTWKSKKTITHEAEVAKKKAEQEAKDKAKVVAQ
jgi:hypothetical protein